MQYYATSKDTIKEIPKVLKSTSFYLEYNPNIGMWRINCKGDVPDELAGYSAHKLALINKVITYVRKCNTR